MIPVLHFEFGEIQVFEYYVIVLMKEGITVKPKHNKSLEMVAENILREKNLDTSRFGSIRMQ